MPKRRRFPYTFSMTLTPVANRPTSTTLGHALLDRLMAADWDGAGALLSADVQFRAITPRKFFELESRSDVIAAFRNWFLAGWRDGVDGVEDGAVEGRARLRYRVRWTDAYGQPFVFEQQVYYEADDSGITWIELMCSGHIPVTSR
jgi:hypothetical protein